VLLTLSRKKIQLDFLWGGVGDEVKFHLVSWSKVYIMISPGGFDPRSLREMAMALQHREGCFVEIGGGS
jgi:hypothetical protein